MCNLNQFSIHPLESQFRLDFKRRRKKSQIFTQREPVGLERVELGARIFLPVLEKTNKERITIKISQFFIVNHIQQNHTELTNLFFHSHTSNEPNPCPLHCIHILLTIDMYAYRNKKPTMNGRSCNFVNYPDKAHSCEMSDVSEKQFTINLPFDL